MSLSLMNVLGFSSSVLFAHVTCYWILPFSLHTSEQIMPILRILCYNGSLVIWTYVSLITVKFKPIIFSLSGYTLSYTANMFILMIVCDFCLSPAQVYYITVHKRSGSQSESELHCDWRLVSRSVLVSSPVWGSWPDINYCLTVTLLSLGGRPLWREDGSVVCQTVSSVR
jgi:ABC-type Fe3+-siderophore transport system permease subunit